MKTSKKKRAPHGATSLIVLDALVRLHTKGRYRKPVSRAELLAAVNLSEFTVDDRLRTLRAEGRILRVGRAIYVPKPWEGEPQLRSKPIGTKTETILPDGILLVQEWKDRSALR